MSVCPTVSVLRFYGCCHPCFKAKIYNKYDKSVCNLFLKLITHLLFGLKTAISLSLLYYKRSEKKAFYSAF